MKTIDRAFIVIAILLQLGIAAFLLWAASVGSLNTVLSGGQASGAVSTEVARLVSDYRQALGIAREIFIDVGVALLCSAGLTAIVLFRQWRAARS
jgi:hypothetical protein